MNSLDATEWWNFDYSYYEYLRSSNDLSWSIALVVKRVCVKGDQLSVVYEVNGTFR